MKAPLFQNFPFKNEETAVLFLWFVFISKWIFTRAEVLDVPIERGTDMSHVVLGPISFFGILFNNYSFETNKKTDAAPILCLLCLLVTRKRRRFDLFFGVSQDWDRGVNIPKKLAIGGNFYVRFVTEENGRYGFK